MLQISQIKRESLGRTFVNLVMAESKIVDHMEVTFLQSVESNRTLKKTVFVFKGYEYSVTFYNDKTGFRETKLGQVISISGDNNCPGNQYFTMQYLVDGQPNSLTGPIEGMPKCGCVLNTVPDSKYHKIEVIEIPVRNIVDMTYAPGKPRPKRDEVKFVLVGILADVIKTLRIDLKMLEDNKDNAVREVVLTIGNIYDVAYFNKKDNTVYELTGKLISAEEIYFTSPTPTVVRTCENVGFTDSIYTAECGCPPTDIDKFQCGTPCGLKKDIKFVFDTSEDFSGTYEEVYLHQFRDCVEVGVNEDPEEPVDPPIVEDKPCCDCNTIMEIENDNMKATVNTIDKTVSYTVKEDGSEGTATIEEMINLYLGI